MNKTQLTILIIGIAATICMINLTYNDKIGSILGVMVIAALTGIFMNLADPDVFKEVKK